MSELTFATAGSNIERTLNLNDPADPSAKAGAAVFIETIREVEEAEADNGRSHPVAVRAWVLDGPQAGGHEEDLWVFAKGVRDKISKEPGAKTAGRLEIYKKYGSDKIGLTNLTPEQMKLAQAKNEELKSTDASAAPASGRTAESVLGDSSGKDDTPPPF
jgi:hypothetical protein